MDESHRATEVGGRECGGILSPGRALLLRQMECWRKAGGGVHIQLMKYLI